jgi:hypothetical protein
MTQINNALPTKACQEALRRNGVSGCVKPNLEGLTLNCGNCGGNAGQTGSASNVITINCDKASSRTPLHEAVHACLGKLGKSKPDPKPGNWRCPTCGREWGKKKKPYPYVNEEKKAEDVVHSCGFAN